MAPATSYAKECYDRGTYTMAFGAFEALPLQSRLPCKIERGNEEKGHRVAVIR
jgi:hypothetical protein